ARGQRGEPRALPGRGAGVWDQVARVSGLVPAPDLPHDPDPLDRTQGAGAGGLDAATVPAPGSDLARPVARATRPVHRSRTLGQLRCALGFCLSRALLLEQGAPDPARA